MKSKQSIGPPAPTRGFVAHFTYDAAEHQLTLITPSDKLIGLTRYGGQLHSGSAPVVGGGGGGSGEVPTLPEWGTILLGLLLICIGYRQHRIGGGSLPPSSFGSILPALAFVSALALLPAPAQAVS